MLGLGFNVPVPDPVGSCGAWEKLPSKVYYFCRIRNSFIVRAMRQGIRNSLNMYRCISANELSKSVKYFHP
jgi:hypothetical protein